MPPAILVVTGASGAGKTTLTAGLRDMSLPGVRCFSCDDVDVGRPAGAEAPADVQSAMLEHGIARAAREAPGIGLAVFDIQIRPHRAREVLAKLGVGASRVVLVDCDLAERNARLREARGQPELVSAQMDCWAAYLRGQADALDLPIIDTTRAPARDSVESLAAIARQLLPKRREPGPG